MIKTTHYHRSGFKKDWKNSLIQIALCDGSVYVLQLRALLQQSINEEPSVYSDNPLGELAELLVDAR